MTVTPDHLLPFTEPFEDRTLGDLNGQYGWDAIGTDVQGTIVHTGSKAARVTNVTGHASHTFVDNQTDVWTDFYTVPAFGDATTASAPSPNSTVVFCVDTNGMVVAFDGHT